MQRDFVETYKAAAMQRITDLVSKGYTFYVTGQIHRDKLKDFATRMDHFYSFSDSAMQKCRKNKKGLAKFAMLFLSTKHPSIEQDHFLWFLLRTDGIMPPIVTNEQWIDARAKKLVLTTYELVRLPRKDAKKPAWTWRYTGEQYKALQTAVISTIRLKNDKELDNLIFALNATPKFAGARNQLFHIYGIIRREFKR